MVGEAQRASEILYHRAERNGAIWAEIEINRPEKANALTMTMIASLSDVIGDIESDRDVRAVVLRGRGRFFCAGGDIEAWGALSPQDMAERWILPGIRVLNRLAGLPVPVIAALSGHALGGGLELALAADLRIAQKSAKLGVPEVALGMISGWGGVRRLAETIGVARARHMTLLGESITAEQALDWGLVTALADDEADLEGRLATWLARLCVNAPVAIALTKGILTTMHGDFAHHHASAAAQASGTADCKEGVRAFLEKRKPVFRNL
jgi:enoyl-CoA hydratase/carnithine racemase